MMMVQITEKLLELPIYVGIDVHKEKWVISIYQEKELLKTFSMNANAEDLIKHLKGQYGTCPIYCVYEAGFSGYWLQKRLELNGINCIIVNAAEIPTTDYERKRKTDKLDSKKLGKHLASNNLKGIYIPSDQQLKLRSLIRVRMTIAKDKRRVMNRIRGFINFHGIEMSKELSIKLWTKRGLNCLKEKISVYPALAYLIKMYEIFRQEELKAGNQIRNYMRQHETYSKLYSCLLSIPGIGWLSASLLIGELGTMDRFNSLDQLASFCGLVPDVRSSAESHKVLGISKRASKRLRTTLVESAWVNIRYDESMREVYTKAVGSGKAKQKAIIKIGRKLLNRIRAVWIKQEMYQLNYR